jgi:hypothetical protein
MKNRRGKRKVQQADDRYGGKRKYFHEKKIRRAIIEKKTMKNERNSAHV